MNLDKIYPLVVGAVDGRLSRDFIPNRSSIESSLSNYEILDGIREVSFDLFDQLGELKYYSIQEEKKTKELANKINESGELNPLIVVIDSQGPWVLEGGHRLDALRELGAKSFPALIVLDLDLYKKDEQLGYDAEITEIKEIAKEKLFSDTIDIPFTEGIPSIKKVNDMKKWISDNNDLYDNKYTVMYHATGISIPIDKEGLKPTSESRRRSYQSTSGYVYLATTPERAENFGKLGNGGNCRVYAVRVLVRNLKADLDQLSNHRAAGTHLGGGTLAESIVIAGGARIKGEVPFYDIREVVKNDLEIFVSVEQAEKQEAIHQSHQDKLDETGFWGKSAAGCLFLAKRTGRLMFCHRSEDVLEPDTLGTWGGASDPGESPTDTVKREVFEEVRFTGKCKIIPLITFVHTSGFKYFNHLVVVDDEFVPNLNWEAKGYLWSNLENIPNNIHPGIKFLMDNSRNDILRIIENESDTYQVNSSKKKLPRP